MALASLAALVWQASAAVWVIFILLGAALAADSVAGFSIILQFGAPEDRPTYIGLTNTLLAPARTISPIIGGWLASSLGYSWLFAVALAASIAGALMMGWWLKDPQHTHSD
jgi:MFS family permease